MIWRTGLVSPSRSTSGSMAFCTVSDAGYCRAPRPAAVITALEICTAPVLLADRPFETRRVGENPRRQESTLSLSCERVRLAIALPLPATPVS